MGGGKNDQKRENGIFSPSASSKERGRGKAEEKYDLALFLSSPGKISSEPEGGRAEKKKREGGSSICSAELQWLKQKRKKRRKRDTRPGSYPLIPAGLRKEEGGKKKRKVSRPPFHRSAAWRHPPTQGLNGEKKKGRKRKEGAPLWHSLLFLREREVEREMGKKKEKERAGLFLTFRARGKEGEKGKEREKANASLFASERYREPQKKRGGEKKLRDVPLPLPRWPWPKPKKGEWGGKRAMPHVSRTIELRGRKKKRKEEMAGDTSTELGALPRRGGRKKERQERERGLALEPFTQVHTKKK